MRRGTPFRGVPRIYDLDLIGCEYTSWWPRPLLRQYVVVIYALRSEAESPFPYVGSMLRPSIRLRGHWGERKKQRDAKDRWLCEIESRGERPVLIALEMTTEARRQELEARWIRFLRRDGHPLTNRRDR